MQINQNIIIDEENAICYNKDHFCLISELKKAIEDYLNGKQFNPNQPRNPNGTWGSGGLSLPSKYISLHQEEARGGHTILHHIGKSDNFLRNRLERNKIKGIFYSAGLEFSGSFSTLSSAEKLVNSTVDDPSNTDKIARLISGQSDREVLNKQFNSFTGREAYVSNYHTGNVDFRDVDAVRVVLYADKKSPNGYYVKTAFPINRYKVY